MAARLMTLLPRLAALVVIWLLAAASYTLAAGSGQTDAPPTVPASAVEEKPDVLVVPDVRRQAYVFAKGILQDAGFAWRVDGPVEGYSPNTVSSQTPAPGTRVVDNGAPLVVVRLARNEDYPERGLPENGSTYEATPVVLLSDWKKANRATPAPEPEPAQPAEPEPAEPEPAEPQPAEPPPAPAEPEPPAPDEAYREPDFALAGAPREPADELPLPKRARLLEKRMDVRSKPARRLVRHWLYQHTWIVSGASFGWKDGDAALRILIRLDERLERRFGFGGKSAGVARRTLAEVERRKAGS